VAEMSPRVQVKFLRVLQEREFEPVGGTQTISVDVRVVAATNKDLKKEVREGRFRQDLYYRLNVIPIHLPPLRDRRRDITLLVNHFLEKYNLENGRNVNKISPEAVDRLLRYSWPGNVRELENCIERAVVMSPGEALTAGILPDELVSNAAAVDQACSEAVAGDEAVRRATHQFCEAAGDNLAAAREKLIRAVEETIIRRALSEDITHRDLAERLGMSRTTLRKKIRDYGIQS